MMPEKKTFFKSIPDKDKGTRSDAPSPLPLDRNEDFAQDPEARFSRPPWPFRMVCKIVQTLIDLVWEQVEQREAERERLAMKIRLPLYKCDEVIESVCDGVRAMEATADMKYLILVEEDCMCVRDCGTGNVMAQLSFEGVKREDLDDCCLWWLSVAACDADCHIIAVGNEKGLSLCMFCMGKLVLIRDKGFLDGVDGVGRIQFSSNGDFLAITRTGDSDSNKQYIEFLSLPIATWKTEVENAVQHLEMAVTESQGSEEEAVQSQVAEMEEKLRMLHTTLPKPSLVMRVHPQLPPPVSRFSDPCQIYDASLDVKGGMLPTGLSHPLTQHYFESSGKPLERPTMRIGGFHFLKSISIPRPITEDKVVVWWTNCHIVYFYALVNQGKELEAKPVNILPLFTTVITCTAVSADSRILATGQPDGIIVIWDLFSRLAIGTISCSSASITALSISSIANQEYNVIVGSSEGEVVRIKTHAFGAGHEETKFDCDLDDINPVTRLQILSSMPSLVLVSKIIDNTFLSLYDIASGQGVCQISLPVETDVIRYSLPNGQKLYALGSDSKVYSISLSKCGMVKRFVQEPVVQSDFDPSVLTAERVARKLLEEDMQRYQGISSEEFNIGLKELFDSIRPKVKELAEKKQGKKRSQSRGQTSKTGSPQPFDFSGDHVVMT